MRGFFVWVGVCVAACGRIGIDPIAVDAVAIDAPQIDSAPVACATEGAPCDDLNICSTSSTCSSGVCTASPANPTCIVADSTEEFALVQAAAGWFYGFWNRSADGDGLYAADDFAEFVLTPGEIWRTADYQPEGPTFTWAYLSVWGGHPGSYPSEKLPIRRWVSDVTGHAEAVITWKKADTNNGDGTRAILIVDGARVWERAVAFDDADGFVEAVPIEVGVGTRVDLVLDYVGDDGGDTTTCSMLIRSR